MQKNLVLVPIDTLRRDASHYKSGRIFNLEYLELKQTKDDFSILTPGGVVTLQLNDELNIRGILFKVGFTHSNYRLFDHLDDEPKHQSYQPEEKPSENTYDEFSWDQNEEHPLDFLFNKKRKHE